MNKRNKTIIIFGFSGSGKSTIADMIGKKYGLRVVHPSSILRNLLENKKIDLNKTRAGKGFWESKKGIELFKERLKEKQPMDMVSDRLLLKELFKGNIVMDSWSMPWLNKSGLKIYLKGSLPERVRRVAKRGKITAQQAMSAIRIKDNETQKMFKRVYGFDIKKDLQVFDTIIDTTRLDLKQVFSKITDFVDNFKIKKRLGAANNL